MAYIDIDISDYVDEIPTYVLKNELKHRKEGEEKNIPDFKTDKEKLNYLKSIFGLWEIHSNKRLLEEIKLFLQ